MGRDGSTATGKWCRDRRWQCCRGDEPRAGLEWEGWRETGGVRGDEMGIRVGGRTEGQSVWTTEIKGAGTHETKGIAVEGWFPTDDEAVSGGWAYFLCPCLGPLYPQAYMGIQFNCIINAFWLHCVCHTIARPQPPCPLARRRAWLFTKKSKQPLKMCDKSLQYMPHLMPPPSLFLSVWYTVDSKQTNALSPHVH